LSQCNVDDNVLLQAQRIILDRPEGNPLFRRAWHARAFALIVTLVKDSDLPWATFQTRLVERLAAQQKDASARDPEQIDLQYFDCWLEAVEDTLIAQKFIERPEISAQIERIRQSVADIRHSQMSLHPRT